MTAAELAQIQGAVAGRASSLALLVSSVPDASITVRSITYGGSVRSYLVIAPKVITTPLPAIVALAGQQASPVGESERDGLIPLATSGQAILIYPAGYEESWNVGRKCCGQAGMTTIDDTGFVAAATKDAISGLDIDAHRVYLLGYSNGARLTWSVVCADPDLFAAFTAVSGEPVYACTGSQTPVPMQLLIGSEDNEGDVYGVKMSAPAALTQTTAVWTERDGCSGDGVVSTVGHATITTYSSCSAGTTVRTVLYNGGVHLWPTAALWGTAASGATLVWSFFTGVSAGTK